ncbi:P-loop NTPase family protein, partial [Staphylococcus epidermidis]
HPQDYLLIHTPRITKKPNVYQSTEKYSLLPPLKAIHRSQLLLLLIHPQQAIIQQHKPLPPYAHDQPKPILILLNKSHTLQ